ncbi:MAG: hypothetical protein LBS55_01505 [Prevotellaceae bacterium]|jgi:hypothetical protein|nr:hypothetical protein [Prevotellaceae bacterium]
MNDVKSIVSAIKILERIVGILENCNDIGEIPDVTRKRVIEMLNKATLEIYFLNNDLSSGKTPDIDYETDKQKQVIVESVIADVVENVAEKIPQQESFDVIPEEEAVSQDVILMDSKFITEEDIVEDNIIYENDILDQQNPLYDKPLFEWELDKMESVQKPQEANNESDINALKLQLEEERKRLEEELRNWQDEKLKRDEEIIAAKKLLENLQQQTIITQSNQQIQQEQQSQQVQRSQQPQQPQQVQRSQQSQPQQVQRSQQPQPQQPPQPQQSQEQLKSEPFIKSEFLKEPPKKEEVQESIGDHFVGKKKVLHESFESNNVVNQISTPVSSLPKSIGINDRFRFIKELFGGDSDLYNDTIRILDGIGSLVSALSYIESNFSWDKNSDSVKQFVSLMRRRYM